MDRFVKKCRKEWKRLRVPDAIANEMAAELDADLREAATDGVTPEELLGVGIFDPRAFAESWATERGVARPQAVHPGLLRSPVAVMAVTFAILAAVGLGLLLGSRDGAGGSAFARTVVAGPGFPRVRLRRT